MTASDIEDALKAAGIKGRLSAYPWAYRVDLDRDSRLFSYDQLAELSRLLGTTKIDIRFEEGGGGYSEYTPGDPDQVWLEIRL